MIEPFSEIYTKEVLSIWYDTNVKAHPYISSDVWEAARPFVKKAFSQAEIWVYKPNLEIYGFIGLEPLQHIAGLFVRSSHQCTGVGSNLIKFMQNRYRYLTVDVFCKNTNAISFYTKHGFKTVSENKNSLFNEKEYRMVWEKIKNENHTL